MSLIIPHRFQVLALSNANPVARSAHYFWQAARERRLAEARGDRPLARANLTLHQLAETAPKPVATRATDLLAKSVAPTAPSQPGDCA